MAFTVAEFHATSRLEENDCTTIDPAGGLCLAAARVFARLLPEELQDLHRWKLAISFTTNIPRQAGMSGSSAIILAVLRALALHFKVELLPMQAARLALAAEREELSITAGPQDRVIQAHQGVLAMDFTDPGGAIGIEALDPALIPPCYLAWNPQPGTSSGNVHTTLMRRWKAGEPEVVEAIAELPELVLRGRTALIEQDVATLAELVDRNFELRSRFFPICAGDRRMVELGRNAGAAVKLCGSGGAVIGIPRDPEMMTSIEAMHRDEGFGFRVATVQP